MIFQGTVLGPSLWNVFCEDARMPLHKSQYSESVFADDLNAYREFTLDIPNDILMNSARECQRELHKWGRANQVAFDPKKESTHCVSHVAPEGEDFKILGVRFDCRLTMANAVHELVSEMRWRISTFMRPHKYHSTVGTINMYKAKVLSFIECRTPAIFHACPSMLQAIDRAQERFMNEIGVSEFVAFTVFNLAPLKLRRGIGMLGLIHRTLLGRGPPHFQKFFFRADKVHAKRPRFECHDHQLHEYRDGREIQVVDRSALGLVSVYNLLPPEIVEASSVKIFQTQLQNFIKDCAHRNSPAWQDMCSATPMMHNHPLVRERFGW